GSVKVLDFGLAKLNDSDANVPNVPNDPNAPNAWSLSPTFTSPAATRIGMILGTPAYMSPEQARGKVLDKRTDIWSFGCVLYEMLTGRAAFPGETITDTLAAVLDREPDWEALPRSTPIRLRELLRRCVQKDVNRRLRDIGDARLELDEVSTPTDAPTVLTNERNVVRRRILQIVAASSTVGIAFIAAAYLAGRSGSASPPTFRQLTFRHGTIGG